MFIGNKEIDLPTVARDGFIGSLLIGWDTFYIMSFISMGMAFSYVCSWFEKGISKEGYIVLFSYCFVITLIRCLALYLVYRYLLFMFAMCVLLIPFDDDNIDSAKSIVLKLSCFHDLEKWRNKRLERKKRKEKHNDAEEAALSDSGNEREDAVTDIQGSKP